MTPRTDALLLWTPRVAGILLCLFLSLFALDAFGGGKTRQVAGLPDPPDTDAAPPGCRRRVLAVGVGRAVVFTGLAVAYAYMARRNPTWVLASRSPPARWAAVPAESTHHGRLRMSQ